MSDSDQFVSANEILLFLELSKNLRYAEDKLDSSSGSNDIHSAIRLAEQAKDILEKQDGQKELDEWKNHRKQLKEWANDILLKAEKKKIDNEQKETKEK